MVSMAVSLLLALACSILIAHMYLLGSSSLNRMQSLYSNSYLYFKEMLGACSCLEGV